MPLIQNSSYRAPFLFQNGHIQTIYPTLLRKIKKPDYTRERIFTPDKDFLDLDWSRAGGKNLVILCHGLEGDSYRKYIAGMVQAFNASGCDALAWNYRSCSGESNRTLRFYHQGSTGDLECVVRRSAKDKKYNKIFLAGFSLGGNLILNYLAEKGAKAANDISRAAVFSAPCDIASSAERLARPENIIYMKRFLKLLHEKIRAKMKLFPGEIDDKDYEKIKTFEQYDNRYTAPLHGFRDARDYWTKCSTTQKIAQIQIPTLIVNARNDPMLAKQSFPVEQARKSKYVHLETPQSGGHAGFIQFNKNGRYWSEERALEFFEL